MRVSYADKPDTDRREPEAIAPYANAEPLTAANLGRPPEVLRKRTEVVRSALDDVNWSTKSDAAWLLTGPKGVTVSWTDVVSAGGTGIVSISTDLWLTTYLTAGDVRNTPPIASTLGSIPIVRSDGVPALQLVTKLRAAAYGDGLVYEPTADKSLSVVFDARSGQLRVAIVAGVTTRKALASALRADPGVAAAFDVVETPATADGDFILATQPPTRITGTIDAELHIITPATLKAFFADPANALDDGDSLCLWFGTVAERRKSIIESASKDVTVSALFNSRRNPERLDAAIPLFKALGGFLHVHGVATKVRASSTSEIGSTDAAGTQYAGAGPWADGTLNPPMTVEKALQKIVADLGGRGVDGASRVSAAKHGALKSGTLRDQLTQLEGALVPHGTVLPGFVMHSGPALHEVTVRIFTASFDGTFRTLSKDVVLDTQALRLATPRTWWSVYARWDAVKEIVVVDLTEDAPDLNTRTVPKVPGSVFLGRIMPDVRTVGLPGLRTVRAFHRVDRHVRCLVTGDADPTNKYGPGDWWIGDYAKGSVAWDVTARALPPGISTFLCGLKGDGKATEVVRVAWNASWNSVQVLVPPAETVQSLTWVIGADLRTTSGVALVAPWVLEYVE